MLNSSLPEQSQIAKASCEERSEQISKSLEADNALRHALEQGQRGDCLHKSWMDRMRQFGIKQASFLIEYSWRKERVSFKIKSTGYWKSYYSNNRGDEINDQQLLREIRESGLEQELGEAILTSLQNSVFAKREKNRASPDRFLANLLDDEALPVLDIIF